MSTTFPPTGARVRPVLLAALLATLTPACRREPLPRSAAPVPTPTASAPAAAAAAGTTPDTAAASATASDTAPTLTPDQALTRFRLPEGYRVELVAAEPLVQDPVAIDFDADGRMYVVEMRGYMPNIEGKGEDEPVGRVVVVEDVDDDGRMDRRTVFLDSLVLPRAVRALSHGVLVAAPPSLWLARDTTGDGRADTRVLVRDDYGTRQSNPEHNANGLLWGLDNWLHNANWNGQLRLQPDGGFRYRATPSLGQWGVSMDEQGRLYRNSNEDPLRADLVPSHYAARRGNDGTLRGVYERLTANVPVWPAHPTPGVNRGYREQTLRADSTLAHYTSAGSPTAYVGDRLPAELRRSVFVTEPAGNLVGRFDVRDSAGGMPVAHRAYERSEFLASTDERFRPVNVASAPDGTLYVVDMYRGIIQHRAYITGYLEQQIRARGLENPIGLGRIYRVVHASTQRGPAPRLARESSAQLVQQLAHPNGWWRTTAQRLLVERRDSTVAPALRTLARSAPDARTRLHALWTLEGLATADVATIQGALADGSPSVRASALRIAEPWLASAGHPVEDAVQRLLADSAPAVQRQLVASLGELPAGRRDAALATAAARLGDDPLVADLVASALRGRELRMLERLLAMPDGAARGATVERLAAALWTARDAGGVQRVLAWAGEPSRPRAQRLALLSGMNPGAGRREAARLTLASRPAALLALTESADTVVRARARALAAVLTWPGRTETRRATVAALTPDEQRRVAAGRTQYAASCAGCHQATGTGLTGVAKSLVGSPWVLGATGRLIRVVQHGKEGESLMPPVGATMSDAQLAAVLSYVRRSWGNEASAVAPGEVREVRGATMGRRRPWTEAELRSVTR